MKIKPSTIIYINGASSSGKTTLTHYLQSMSPTVFLRLGVDMMIRHMLPPNCFSDDIWHKNDWYYWQTITTPEKEQLPYLFTGKAANECNAAYIQAASALADNGQSLIIDDVALHGIQQAKAWFDAFEQHRLIKVGLQCPVEILEQREKASGDRMLKSAKAQSYWVHEGIEYDLICDSSKEDLKAFAKKILSNV